MNNNDTLEQLDYRVGFVELTVYPESRYDETDRKCLDWLERGYRSGVFQSLPVQAQKTVARKKAA